MTERELIVKLREALEAIKAGPQTDRIYSPSVEVNWMRDVAAAALAIPVPGEVSRVKKRLVVRDMLADMRGEIEG